MNPIRFAPALLVLFAAGCGGSREESRTEGAGGPAAAAPSSAPAPPAPPPPTAPGGGAAPVFRKLDPAATRTTESGLRCQVLQEGTGATPGEEDGFELEWALWSAEGDLLESSKSSGASIQGRKADMGLPFLKEAPFLMKEGTEALFEVPSNLAWGKRAVGKIPPGATTVWRLRMVRVNRPRPAPAFVLPPESDLKRTASGLGIQVLREGAGEAPRLGEQVVVHYAGWLADSKPGEATPFDASYGRGAPTAFRLGEVIEGWNEGLPHLKPGGEAILVIPANLGYGDRGAGKSIPPGAALVFRVELLEVKR